MAAATDNRDRSPLEPFVRAIEAASLLDAPANFAARRARRLFSSSMAVKEAVSGTWLGHALHPALTDVVIGSFLSASALDVLAGRRGRLASRRLIALGIAAYGPTAAAGVSDWADGQVDEKVSRVGIVHASGNLVALSLYSASLRARRRGAHARGALLSGAGAAVLMTGAYLGGHLSLRRGIGPDQTVFDPGPDEWRRATGSEALPESKPTRVVVDDTPVLLVRAEGQVRAIHDRCSHRGCSLAEGEVHGNEVTCGCHGSRFDLRTGALLGGPATAPQPAFDVREQDGGIEVRLRAD